MPEERQGLFRKQALERMSSPDRLDELVQIISPKDWLLLGAVLLMSLLVTGWCIWGRLPTTVSGQGVILRPRRIMDIQSQAAGKLVNFNIRVGDELQKGSILGVIDQAEIRKQMQQDRLRLAELESQDRRKSALEGQQLLLRARDVEAQKKALLMQSTSREESLKAAEALVPVLKMRLDSIRQAVSEGLEPNVSPQPLLAQREYSENQTVISDLKAQRSQIDSQIKELDSKQAELTRTLFEASTARKNQILELRKNIALSEVQLQRNTEIIASYSGRVVEVVANLGQVVSPGSRLVSIEVQQPAGDLVCVSYFAVRDGKRIKPGMVLQVTPDTVKRERFGGIRGVVSSVSTFPITREGAALLLGNREVAARLLQDEPQIEVIAQLEKDASTYSGYKWTSSKGPRLAITAGTTASNRVTVEMRSPVTYILPFLRGMSGVY